MSKLVHRNCTGSMIMHLQLQCETVTVFLTGIRPRRHDHLTHYDILHKHDSAFMVMTYYTLLLFNVYTVHISVC